MSGSTSLGSAKGVYQKVVPQPVRAAAANHLPPRVRSKVKRRLARAMERRESRLHQRALKQVRETDFAHWPERRATALDGRVGHVHSGLTPGMARRLDHDLITTALDMAKIPWFAVPALDDRRLVLAVPQAHKGSVRRVLRALLEEQTGYVVSVSPADAESGKVPGSHLKAWKSFAKARVIRVVWLRTDPTESLWIGDGQGVEIEFWTTNTALPTPRLIGPRPNRVQRVSPTVIEPVEIAFDRLTGYADIDGDAEPTLTQPGFDAPRIEEIGYPVDAVVLWRHDEPWGEELLRATLRSLYQYAPWIDLIHLVASAPVPPWVRTEGRLVVVPAAPDAEADLHRLQDVSEQFLLFRPGAMLARPVRPFDFFTPSGGTRPRRGPWTAEESTAFWIRAAFAVTGKAIAHGYASGPQPYSRKVLYSVPGGADRGAYLVDTQLTPTLTGTHPLDGLHHHTGHCAGQAEPSGEASFALHAASPDLGIWLERLLVRRDAQQFHLFGLGTAQALSGGGTAAAVRFLSHYYPVPGPFEHAAVPDPDDGR